MKVVWVLGAGFSRSLGGPLIGDLISTGRTERIAAAVKAAASKGRYPGIDAPALVPSFCTRLAIVASHMGPQEKGVALGRPWADAEEYVAMVESAVSGDAAMRELVARTLETSDLEGVRRDSLIYLAAACHAFVQEPEVARDMERWEPYIRWAGALQADDEVISFNYDTVVETAARAGGADLSVPLWKLHGSVDEFDGRPDKLDCAGIWGELLQQNAPRVVVPGPDKGRASRGILADRWERAALAVQAADVIVMIGYRFAQTDQHAKRRFIEALSRNNQQIMIRVVLGSDTRGPDAARVSGMLRWALRDRGKAEMRGDTLQFRGKPGSGGKVGIPMASLRLEPLFAEDFLAVFDRSCLDRSNF